MKFKHEDLVTRLAGVRERIASAARRVHRDPATVQLLLACKTQNPGVVRSAYRAGARDFGENYVQEAEVKRAALSDLADARWHLIGHLQSNKAATAVRTFDVIQSLDSERLAVHLARASRNARVRTLLEVNLANEPNKSGVRPEEVESLVEAVRDKVDVLGLMAVPPACPLPDLVRPYFSRLRLMRDRLASNTGLKLSELSMGMTDDFEVAIEEGSTIVRIGRAVFGDRPVK